MVTPGGSAAGPASPARIVGVRPERRSQAGYSLVVLMVAVTILLIMVTAALPLWSAAMKREREEELIFRGLQYSEAIRLFQQRFGRLPIRLDELIKVRPRCIRQLWPDPMTGKVDWVLIRVAGQAGQPQNPGGQDVGGGADPGSQGDGGGLGAGSETPDGSVGLGPIRGVRSRDKGKALKTFFGAQRYDRWQFTVELVQAGGIVNVGGAGVPGAAGPRLSSRWIGRPFRPGLQPPGMQQGLPGDQPPPIGQPVDVP